MDTTFKKNMGLCCLKKGTLHAKKSTIRDRNDMDLTEAEDIKKR